MTREIGMWYNVGMRAKIVRSIFLVAIAAASLQLRAAPTAFAKGADLSWVTELESRGFRWNSTEGEEMECFALMKSIGFNAVRLRVWVDPQDGWNSGDDLANKARRAAKLKLPVMLDFHYSDSWADPGKQFKPASWAKLDRAALLKEIGEHTAKVLSEVKATGAEIAWVQVGNEVRPGLLWDANAELSGALYDVKSGGRTIAAANRANFAAFLNAGAKAVRRSCPRAKIIVHCDHGDKWGDLAGVLDAAKKVDYDIFGVSLYPKEDWGAAVKACAANLERVKREYGKSTMVCEFGMPTHPFDPARDATSALLSAMRRTKGCSGVFYWEPESFPEAHDYKLGACTAKGMTVTPSPALAPFAAK